MKAKLEKPTFRYEIDSSPMGEIIAGVDEVGRGSLAGPIVAAAVVFEKYDKVLRYLRTIRDSKILTSKKREELEKIIRKKAVECAIGVCTVEEIDSLGIGVANVLAFKRALDGLSQCDLALIDGRKFRGFDYKYVCLEKGESKSISIAAASIVAKVYRDSLMVDLHQKCPDYDFASNKGYGGKKHYIALEQFGATAYHRKTFLRKFEERKSQNALF